MPVDSETLVAFIQSNGLPALFVAMILEEVLFVIPAGIIIVASGATLVQASSTVPALIEIFLGIALVGSAGITLGSFFMYGIGFYGGKPAVNRVGRRFGVSYEDVEHWEEKLGREREKEYFALFRVLPVFPITTISAAAGVLRMNRTSYAVITFLGMIPRHMFYGYLGWKAGSNYSGVVATTTGYSKILTVSFLLIAAVYLGYRYSLAKKLQAVIRRKF